MFYKLVFRNSRRERKENGLFFSSLLVAIVAFYIILSLPYQDVMRFLARMESDAVNRLLAMIPAFYGLTLCLMFFLIYYASRFQLERRRHEFGVYLMSGMRRIKLFALLLAEDFQNSVAALLLGLPIAVLLSELISLLTARLVGLGIIGHQSSFSLTAALETAAGFLLIKFAAFLILSGKISRQEIGTLLADQPEGVRPQKPWPVYAVALIGGIGCLAAAYTKAIRGLAWYHIMEMGRTLFLGTAGTFLLFWGLRLPLGLLARRKKSGRHLHVFHFRQLQETVISRSGALALGSLLLLAALCFFGAGVAISRFYGEAEHILDYTFVEEWGERSAEEIRQALQEQGLEEQFSHLFEVKVGYIRTTEDYEHAFEMKPVLEALDELQHSSDTSADSSEDSWRNGSSLQNHLRQYTYPHLIALSGYNELLAAAGLPELMLGEKEAALFQDAEFANEEDVELLNTILKTRPKAQLDGQEITLTGEVQTASIVTDRSITLALALILPDEAFDYYTQENYDIYLNGILAEEAYAHDGLMAAISSLNEKLDAAGLPYGSYLQNMGRQLFYMVAASYITIYLAIIFLLIADTMIGVQFLTGQRKPGHRDRSLEEIQCFRTYISA